MCGSVSVGAALRWILIKSTTYSSVIWRWWRTRWRRQWLLLLLLSLKFWRLTVVGNECFQLVAAASLAAAVFLSTAEFVFGYCICFRCSLLKFSLLSMNIYFIHTYVTICCVIPFQVMPISSVLFVVITTLIILAMLMHSLNFNWLSNRNAKAHSRHNRTA